MKTKTPAAERAVRDSLLRDLVKDHLDEVFEAAVKAYAARYEACGGATAPPIDRGRVSATEVVIVASELMRAQDLNLLDVAMWFGRPVVRSESGDSAVSAHG